MPRDGLAAQATRSLPVFSGPRMADRAGQVEAGDPSTSYDAQDNVWLCIGRGLSPGDASMAAPPVLFNTAGAFIKAWAARAVAMNG